MGRMEKLACQLLGWLRLEPGDTVNADEAFMEKRKKDIGTTSSSYTGTSQGRVWHLVLKALAKAFAKPFEPRRWSSR